MPELLTEIDKFINLSILVATVYFIASLNKETHFFGVTVKERKAFWVTFSSFIVFNIYFVMLCIKLLAEWLSDDKTFIDGLTSIFLHKSIITPFYFGRGDTLSHFSGFMSFLLLHIIWTYFAFVTWRILPEDASKRLTWFVICINILLVTLAISSIQVFYYIIFYPSFFEALNCPVPYSILENFSIARSVIASEKYRWAAFFLWLIVIIFYWIRNITILKKE